MIKAILRLAIFEIVFVPSSEFEAIVLSHIYNILFENVPLTSDKDVFFTVNALLRVYEENCDVKWKENGIEEEDDYEKPPEVNYDLVEWLEDHLQTDNEKLKASITTLLFAVKHETPTQ